MKSSFKNSTFSHSGYFCLILKCIDGLKHWSVTNIQILFTTSTTGPVCSGEICNVAMADGCKQTDGEQAWWCAFHREQLWLWGRSWGFTAVWLWTQNSPFFASIFSHLLLRRWRHTSTYTSQHSLTLMNWGRKDWRGPQGRICCVTMAIETNDVTDRSRQS